MNKRTIITLAVVVAIVGLGIYEWDSSSLYKNEAPKSHQNNPAIQLGADLKETLLKVEAANTPSSSVEWNLYQPKNLLLTFSYPSGVLIQDVTKHANIYTDTPENRAYLKNPDQYEGSRPGMYIAAVSQTQAPEDYAKQNFPDWQYATTKLFGDNAVVLAGQGMDRWDCVLFKHNGTLYQVTIQYGSQNGEDRATYYKILSSFSFIE